MIEWDVIRSDIIIGTHPQDASDIDTIAGETGATAVLNVQHPEGIEAMDVPLEQIRRRARANRLKYVHSPMRDFDPQNQRETLPDAIRALSGLLQQDHSAYVHCTAGVNRSPLVVLGYLVFVEGMKKGQALNLILNARPQARPYMDVFEQVQRDLLRQHEQEIRRRAYQLHTTGANEYPDEDWLQAQKDVLREVLSP
ncbi:MAG: dual specificity protein phosphatase family protein [Armatimonadota bacterium]